MSWTTDMAPVQRIRVIFSKGEPVKYISHLAVMRAWERIVRRADVPVAYSQGFNPRPKLTFASALAVGYTGRAEVMDVELRIRLEPNEFLARIRPQLPRGFMAHSAVEVPLRAPALPAEMRYAEYVVSLLAEGLSADEVRARLQVMLTVEHLPRWRKVKNVTRQYDLRPLICEVWYVGLEQGSHKLGMVLKNDNTAAGRPDEVIEECGWIDRLLTIERVKLIFKDDLGAESDREF